MVKSKISLSESMNEAKSLRKKNQNRLETLSEIFGSLGVNATRNIDIIVKYAGQLLGGTCAIYNRLENKKNYLVAWTGQNVSRDMVKQVNPAGHICYESVIKGNDNIFVLEDIKNLKWEKGDKNIVKCKMQSYIGGKIFRENKTVGSLCVVNPKPRKYTKTDINILKTLCNALSLQEEHYHLENVIMKKNNLLKALRKISELLLKNTDYKKALSDAIEIMGKATDTSRLLVVQKLNNEKKHLIISQTHEWVNKNSPPIKESPEINKFPIDKDTYDHLIKTLKSGLHFETNIKSESQEIKEFFLKYDIKSWILAPIFLEYDFWGVLIFEHRDYIKYWTLPEIDTIMEAAQVIGFCIQRSQRELALQKTNDSLKKTMGQLRKSEKQFRSLYENATLGLYRTTPDGQILLANPALVKMLDYSSFKELAKINLEEEGFAPEYSREEFKKMVENKDGLQGEVAKWFTPAGDIKYMRESANAIRDSEGKILYYEGTVEDITEEYISKEKVKVGETLYKTLVETSPDGIALLDVEGNPIFYNQQLANLFKYELDEMLDHNFFEYIPEEHFIEIRAIFHSKLKENEIIIREIDFIRKDESHFCGRISIALVLYETSTRENIICIVHDITNRIQKEKKIQRALAEKEVMLKEIHHRVKNNLQLVTSLINLQIRHVKNEADISLFRDTQNRVRAMALIHESLYRSDDLSHIDFLDYVKNLLHHVFTSFHGMAQHIQYQIDIKSISLDINKAIPCGLIIDEIITNSMKYAFPNNQAGNIWVNMKKLKDENVRLEIRDNGIGLPNDKNMENSKTLGMELIQTLTRQLHGKLKISNDNGAKFQITFPMVYNYPKIPKHLL